LLLCILIKVEKQEMVVKAYFRSQPLVAIFSTEATGTLLPYWFSNIVFVVDYRTQVNNLWIQNIKRC